MECGECTLCCEILKIPSLNKPARTKCQFCDKGCTIHATKPEECRLFECAYYQMKEISIELRPDKCGVIFERISDDLFLGLMQKGAVVEGIVERQIIAFGSQGFSVVLNSPDFSSLHIYPAPGRLAKDIYAQFQSVRGN